MDILRLLRTVRHLRPVQLVNRVSRRLVRRSPGDAPAGLRRTPIAPMPAPVIRHAGWDGADRFELLGRSGIVATAQDWNAADAPKLWLYHLHYFEDLMRPDAPGWRDRHAALIRRWIEENPPTTGNGWEPYPIALRSVFWMKWALAGGTLDAPALDSLARQLRHLENNLEFHLLGNHLWADAKALYMGGLFFEGAEADRWYGRGLDLLRRERAEQILGDGGHFERSPAYHCLILEDVLDLVALGRSFGRPLAADWDATAAKMLEWLSVMTRPDGRIVAWNDAARNAVPAPGAVLDYAARLGITHPAPSVPLHHLAQTGYARHQSGPFTLWFDAGAVGPDYIPGHAHADSLNIELSVGTSPLLVDTGTSTYAIGPRRSLERSTAAHNCVVVADRDSTEVWGGFRVGRRAYVHDVTIAGNRLAASHDGYRHIGTTHRRAIEAGADGIAITDIVDGRHAAGVAHFHLASGLAPERSEASVLTPLARFDFDGAEALDIEPWFIADGFNDLAPSFRLAVRFTGRLVTRIAARPGQAAGSQ